KRDYFRRTVLMRIIVTCSMLILAFGGKAFADKTVSIEDLRKHSTESDCWMAIDGVVYDMSQFIAVHKEECRKMKLTELCGGDGSQAWKQKEAGNSPHKKKSLRSLEKAKIGRLANP